MFIRMLALADDAKESVDLSSHRTAIHSAAPCPRHVKEAMMQWWGPILHEYYSSTEDVGVTYASPQEWLTHPGTVGRPPGFRIHICGDDGNELPPNATGLVYFETRAAGFAYHGDEDKTRESRQGGHWSRDLAYAISSCLDIEDRRNWENELIGRYLSVFAEHSGHQIPFDEAYLLYRQQIFAALQFWTITFTPSESMPDMQSSDIAIRNIERISTAVDDLDSIGAFA
jgi:acyl-CoA synthetase (AMP-forming)/AMP-acid ligase II